MPNAAAFPEIEIFRAGRHVALDGTEHTITHADVAAIAAAYDPAVGEAPHVIGHPQLNGPAYGWVRKLEARDGVLFAAQSDQVDPAFAEIVEKGRYKKRSASFFGPDTPGNPTPGRMYLRHVGWLGATPPSVTGLRDAQFAADAAGVIEFAITDRPWVFRQIADGFRRLRDHFVEQVGVEKTETFLPAWLADSIAEAATPIETSSPSFAAQPPQPETTTVSNQNTADFAARESALNTRQQSIEQREAALRQAEAKALRDGVVEFAAGLVKAGKLLPRQQAPIVELLVALEGDAAAAPLSFAAADGSQASVARGAALRAFLGELPQQVDFAERGAGETTDTAVDFAAPLGVQVSRDRLELHGRALEYQRQHPGTSYVEAVAAVGG